MCIRDSYSTLPLIAASASMAITAVYYAIVAWRSRNLPSEAAEQADRESLIVVASEVAI